MKKVFIGMALFAMIGCKEDGSDQPAAPAISQIQSMGCTASKHGVTVSITCADGSNASFGIGGTFHIKESSGTEHENLVFVSNDSGSNLIVVNKSTGDTLFYGSDGALASASLVWFDQMNCTGNAYINRQSYAGTLVKNSGGYPSNAQALRVVGNATNVVSLSTFTNGTCTNVTQLLNDSARSKVLPVVTLDSTIPETLETPIQLMLSQ